MLNDFTGGGQIFLHKIRMFLQVLDRSFSAAFFCSVAIVGLISYKPAKMLDNRAAVTYQKALLVNGIDESMRWLRVIVNPQNKNYYNKIDAWTDSGLYARDIDARKIIKSASFKVEYTRFLDFLYMRLLIGLGVMSSILLLIYIYWSKFGAEVKSEKHISGATIKTAREVASYLRSTNNASKLMIAEMPLVKDSETRHILVTGSTGSGKTNLINNIVPQIIRHKQPALVIDQTGEMIARYYDPTRGDIIFNPLDERSHSWDFWADTALSDNSDIHSSIEKFAKILFSYGKKPNSGSDPFWDNSANAVFCACVEYLHKHNKKSYAELKKMCSSYNVKDLARILGDTKASRYLQSNSVTAGSILSVLSTNTKPLNLLFNSEKQFSLTKYFDDASKENPAWLFLSSAPHCRELTAPLTAGLFELSISQLMKLGANHDRRFWFILDELASLGRLNGIGGLMSEARKYGGCVLAATQSFNQLFENFGQYGANHLFSQFATKFIFRSDDAISTKMLADIAGELEYTLQQKNTSFGANELRDGISYTEQQKRKKLITTDQLASLGTHECFVSLPEPKIRIAKIKVPLAIDVREKHQAFAPRKGIVEDSHVQDNDYSVITESDEDYADTDTENNTDTAQQDSRQGNSQARIMSDKEDQNKERGLEPKLQISL